MSDGYEFDANEDEVIARLAGAMQNVGIVSLLGSGAGLIYGVITLLVMIHTGHPAMAVLVLILMAAPFASAIALLGAGSALMGAVRTEGEDIPLVMRGMRRLTVVYMLEILLNVVALGFITLLLVWALT
jgi:hypothetical protein